MELGKLNRYRSWLISGALALLVVVWLGSGQVGGDDTVVAASPADSTEPAEVARASVRVRTQQAEEVTRTIVVNGMTEPARVVTIAAETDGRIEVVGARRGASVDRGAVIVRLDERDRSVRLAEARATVTQRKVEYEARERLKSESYVSAAQLKEAIAMLETARVELTRAELDLEYMVVRAPFDGALQARHVEVGDFVSVGDPIASFVDNRRIVVSADVSEFDAAYVQPGQPAEATLATGEQVQGTIRYVAPVADEATRTFTVELEVDNQDGSLRAGGTAKLMIPAERVLAHRIAPSLLTLDDAGNVGVKIVNEQDEVEFVVADIALSSDEGIWLAGLPDSATIITVGQGFVSQGAAVNAVPEGEAETAVAIKTTDEDG